MNFIQLVSALRLVDAQLAHALVNEDRPSRHARLLRDSADLLERIETHAPRTFDELREMMYFFARRSLTHRNVNKGRHDFDIAASLARRFEADAFPAPERRQAPDAESSPASPRTADPVELARLISGSPDNLAAIDPGYRILAVSPPKAAYFKAPQMAMIDRHLCDVIGADRFHKRARGKIDLCLQGAAQDYIYLLDDPIDGQRVIRCKMTPVGVSRGRAFCVLVLSRDVTTEARRLDRIAQNEPGTT